MPGRERQLSGRASEGIAQPYGVYADETELLNNCLISSVRPPAPHDLRQVPVADGAKGAHVARRSRLKPDQLSANYGANLRRRRDASTMAL